jgi:myotubularin-related protein 1/2
VVVVWCQPQLTSLVALLLDPHYRTLTGFVALIEREWLSFGHKFAQRTGHGTSEQRVRWNDEQRSPVWVQFIDCVYQILAQFPAQFQFNELFLVELVDAAYCCRFGNFLHNCDR